MTPYMLTLKFECVIFIQISSYQGDKYNSVKKWHDHKATLILVRVHRSASPCCIKKTHMQNKSYYLMSWHMCRILKLKDATAEESAWNTLIAAETQVVGCHNQSPAKPHSWGALLCVSIPFDARRAGENLPGRDMMAYRNKW